jgi:hypothetical protein
MVALKLSIVKLVWSAAMNAKMPLDRQDTSQLSHSGKNDDRDIEEMETDSESASDKETEARLPLNFFYKIITAFVGW